MTYAKLGWAMLAFGLVLVAGGVAIASGNGGECKGEWTERWIPDPMNPMGGTWEFIADSFDCTECEGPPNCEEMSTEVAGEFVCACDTGTGWNVDLVWVNGSQVRACDAIVERNVPFGYQTGAHCAGGCTSHACQPTWTIVPDPYVPGRYTRIMSCTCR